MFPPPSKTSSKQEIWSSQFLRDLSRVVRRTPRDTPVPPYTRTSSWPNLILLQEGFGVESGNYMTPFKTDPKDRKEGTTPLEIITWSTPGNTLCKQICITYSFIVDNPNILGNFLLFAGQNQLGENYLTYSHIWGSQNTFGKKNAYIFGIVRPLQINHVCDNFRPHGTFAKTTLLQNHP